MTDYSSISDRKSRLTGFDAEWYLTTYPDVALTGMSAEDHYLLCGRLIGRAGNPSQVLRKWTDGRAGVHPRDVAARFGQGTPRDIPASDKAVDSPIIAAPQDLAKARALLCADRPPNLGAPQIRMGQEELGRFRSLEDMEALAGPVALYCKMLGLETGRGGALKVEAGRQAARDLSLDDLRPGPCASVVFRTGDTRLDNLWFADEGMLRAVFAGAAKAGSGTIGPHVIRAWVADADDGACLRLVSSMALPDTGPGFCNIPLLNPLMPVLLELSDARGFTTGFALLAFPSLLPGGLHAAERSAWQQGKNPMDDVWRLSDVLLQTFLEGPRQTGFAVSELAVDLTGATGAERFLSRPVRNWLKAVFGLAPRAADTGSTPTDGAAWLVEDLGGGQTRGAQGLILTLPACGVPSLSALVARRLTLPSGMAQAAGPFLVADAVSLRPLWSVSLPLGPWCTPDVPVLSYATPSDVTDDGAQGSWLAPLHLAVICRSAIPPSDLTRLLPVAPDHPVAEPSATALEVSVVVMSAKSPAGVQRVLAGLLQQQGITLSDLLIVPDPAVQPDDLHALREAAAGLYEGQVRIAPPMDAAAADLDQIAALTQTDYILMIADSVVLHDAGCLSELSDIIVRDAQVGSVGCVLLHEEVQGKATRIVPVSGGLFPAGVSFISAPRLIVTEPDVEAALPQATYPVVANTLTLCLIRRAALVATQTARQATMGADADLQFGLNSLAAGYYNLCTSVVRASITRPASRRDDMDPLGLSCLAPARWDDLLSAVTVLRALR